MIRTIPSIPPVPPELKSAPSLKAVVDYLEKLRQFTKVAIEVGTESIVTEMIASGAITAAKVGNDWPKVLLTHSVAQAIADITNTAVTFDTEITDIGGMHAGANPTRITITRAGVYCISAFVDWAFHNTGGRRLRVKKNGATDILEHEVGTVYQNQEGALTLAGHALLAVGDYLELFVFQGSGGSLNVNAAETGVKFAAVWCP